MRHWLFQPSTGVSGAASSKAKMSPNWTNPGLFNISFLYILALSPILILKSPGFVPFWANLTHFGNKSGHTVEDL